MILAVSGSSMMTDADLFAESIGDFIVTRGMVPSLIITGGDKGADQLAAAWARSRGIAVRELKPRWSAHPNKSEAIAASNNDIVSACTHMLAFVHPMGRWTKHAVEAAQEAGKPVVVVPLPDAGVERRK